MLGNFSLPYVAYKCEVGEKMVQLDAKKRDKWGSKLQFILACVGYAVGLGNIWRFPYLCYRSGGGAFLIPYFIMLAFCGIPLLYMEMAIGQLTRLGPIHAMAKLCPLLKGSGLAMVVLSFFLCTYYNVILAWALHYLFHSFTSPLPWKSCGNSWNDEKCWSDDNSTALYISQTNVTDETIVNGTVRESPSFQYFNNFVLDASDGINNMGSLKWELVGYLFLAWAVCYLCTCKGVKSVGKVVYVTALFPYLMLFVLLGRSVTLPGALEGIYYFIVPDFGQLLDPKVWMLAAVQNFGSIGIAYGSLIAFSSYNKETNNILHDTFAIAIINSITSLLAGFVVFSALGAAAHDLGVSVDEAAAAGPDLVFVAIPPLFARLPASNLWAVMFFLMLSFLGIDSQFSMVEVINTSIMDQFQDKLKDIPKRKEIVSFVVCLVCFLLGLPHVTQGGIYSFTLIDNYAVVVPLMFVAYFEVMAVCWFYGGNRLAREISYLSGFRPSYFFPFCWIFISPLLITNITSFNLTQFAPVKYGKYEYPQWAQIFGWIISISSFIWIPVGIVHTLCKYQGTFKQRFIQSITPTFVPNHMKRAMKKAEKQTEDEIKIGSSAEQSLLDNHDTTNADDYKVNEESRC